MSISKKQAMQLERLQLERLIETGRLQQICRATTQELAIGRKQMTGQSKY